MLFAKRLGFPNRDAFWQAYRLAAQQLRELYAKLV